MSEGSLSVLNVGAGDIVITFNNTDPDESAKAIAMLTDMQKRGYFIAVQLEDGTYARATAVDAKRGRYIISVPAGMADPLESEPVTCGCGCGAPVKPGKRFKQGHHNKIRVAGARARRKVSVPVKGTKAVGVARSAGG